VTLPSRTSVDGATRQRSTQPGSARTTLLIALGEFALTSDGPPPRTSALVQALGHAGISHSSARQAIQRCAKSRWIGSRPDGRESRWEITPAGRTLLSDGIVRVESLGTDVEAWDGSWSVLVATIPQHLRSVRERLYRALRWNSYGSPVPGLWVSAHPGRDRAVAAAVHRHGLEQSVVSFTGAATGLGLSERELIARAWDLDGLTERYIGVLAEFAERAPETPSEALAALLELDGQLQALPSQDPQLPSSLVPHWPGREAATQLLALRSEWLGPATACWRELPS
jgi:phenylacetic acid degradation operon negative regulatory protein